MKKIILTLLLGGLSAPLFSQLTFANADSVGNYLKGSWKFFRQCGSIAGICQYPVTLGFSYDLTFTKIASAPDSLKYTLVKTASTPTTGTIKISKPGADWKVGQIKGLAIADLILSNNLADSTTFSEDCADCWSFTFSRNKAVGIEEHFIETGRTIHIYPSPASDQIWISVKNAPVVTNLVIYDNQGKIVSTFKEGSYQCDISDLPEGIYFIKGISKGNHISGKFIKS